MYRCWNLAITSIRGARRNSPSKLQSYSIVTYKPLHSSLLTLRNLKSFYTFNLRLNTCRLWTSRHLLSRYIHTTPSRSTKTASTLIPPQVDAAKAFRLARQELINNVDGIGARTMLRIRLFLMGQVRPMKMDDFVALFSWIFVGNTLFVLARTTAFVSVVIMIVNRLNFQEKVAEFISDLLSRATGFDVKVGAAVVPRWSDGAISLEDVTIVCNGDTWTELKRKEKSAKGLGDLLPGEVDLNWTYWDLTVDRIDVNLSLWRLLDGRGPIKEAKLKGIRGMVDRRHIEFDPNWVPSRRVPEFGDFEMDSFIVEDLLVTICNPDFRPFSFSIFDAELPIFRKQWLLYDMMCADSVVGMYDNCLFSVHRSQSLDVFRDTPGNFDKVSHLKMSSVPIDHLKVGATGPISWLTRGTVDLDLHVLIPRITTNDDVFDQLFDELDGIREVAIDKIEEVIAAHPERQEILDKHSQWKDQKLQPRHHDLVSGVSHDLNPTVVVRNVPKTISNHHKDIRYYDTQYSNATPSQKPSAYDSQTEQKESRPIYTNGVVNLGLPMPKSENANVILHWRVKLNDLKAYVPLSNPHLSYMSSALIRPVVAYMNANRTSLPLASSAKMDINNFNGAWDIFSAGLVDVLSEETGRALSNLVQDERERTRRLRRIGIWSLQQCGKAILSLSEYIRGTRNPWSYGLPI
ncbi:hypothetical protein BDV3_004057 [Batrachochytrium dendrobatidis]|uniref:Mitochondrial distribution and morphology protein 31 n=1 Tax=Batrachochytrium dendrobatidis (strain JEL423) TaxID=403673 RepID=A0A177WGN5_BATDL|nr:Mitochondrial distribution and morphology protein 31, mitochondrial precursor [Batrachochytrium dendrobatidis]KAK5669950.1 Mitochondrial distribution and morphology protein 31, mitochondrial precursor [Batrachochytrium dendrobatidis]OAJ38521.1 hypothetical protein BDEG_22434 [Batrachochytrium dendrobatidis JEL423]